MKKITCLSVLFALVLTISDGFAQYGEPEIQRAESPKNLYDEGYKTGFGFAFNLTDFGFGAGVQLRKGLSSYTEGFLNFKIAGLRDPSEQTYIDYYWGHRTVPSKYKRVVTFPLSVGLKRRVFASQISDNFRVHAGTSFGPSLAVTTPYFKDYNQNGYKETGIEGWPEPIQDIFQGWKRAEWEFGWTGDLVLGVDFGDNFAKLQTFQFGYNFYYYPDGIQIMEPFKPGRNEDGSFIDLDLDGFPDPDSFVDSYDKMHFLGSAQVTFIFGWMW